MKLSELAKELNISDEAIKKFIEDFNLELSDVVSTNLDVMPEFEKFARENAEFLKKYEKDLTEKNSVEEIAEKLDKPVAQVAEIVRQQQPNIYDNGLYKSSVSSYGIDNKLGGNYQFVYNYFGDATPIAKRDFIGYRDVFFYISEALEPFIDLASAKNWGIKKPAGILLYGPPGSGKIFWAERIAEIIGYHFKEVKKYYLGTSFIDGQKTRFNDYLISMMKEDHVLVLLEDFDDIMAEKNPTQTSENEETKDIILHYISRFPDEQLLMVGTANSLRNIDSEVMAPGRFDVQIPIFPPNREERTEMIIFHLLNNLSKDALLYKILEENGANKLQFWDEVSGRMRTFSNTMVVDFTQSIKKRIKNKYRQTQDIHLNIDKDTVNAAFKDAALKLTDEYLDQVDIFLRDAARNNSDGFERRIAELRAELESYKVMEKPPRAIGFSHNEEQ